MFLLINVNKYIYICTHLIYYICIYVHIDHVFLS